MTEERCCFLDYLKAFLMLLVVLGHSVEIGLVLPFGTSKTFYLGTYAFHMPMFIFLQGYFSKKVLSDARSAQYAERMLRFFSVYCISKVLYYGAFLVLEPYLRGRENPSGMKQACICLLRVSFCCSAFGSNDASLASG